MEVTGGMTKDAFPAIEEWLKESVERQKAFLRVAVNKVDRYQSMIDLLFCETFHQFKDRCSRFYQRRVLALKDCREYTPEMKQEWERQLLAGLEHAQKISKDTPEITWNRFHTELKVLGLIAV